MHENFFLEIYKSWLSLDFLLRFLNWLISHVIYIKIKFLIEHNTLENTGYFYSEFFFLNLKGNTIKMHYNYLKVNWYYFRACLYSVPSVCNRQFLPKNILIKINTFAPKVHLFTKTKKSGFSVMKSPIYLSVFNTHPKMPSGIDIKKNNRMII